MCVDVCHVLYCNHSYSQCKPLVVIIVTSRQTVNLWVALLSNMDYISIHINEKSKMSKQIKKKAVIEVFGSVTQLAKAVGVVPQAVSRWPKVLKQYHLDLVISAAWRNECTEALKEVGVTVERRMTK